GTGTETETDVDTPPSLVTVTVSGVPDGTEVYGPRGLMGVAPGPIQLHRGSDEVILTFKADGHVSKSHAVTPEADQPLAITLEPKERGGRAGGNKGGRGGKGGTAKGGKGSGKGSGKGTAGGGTNPLIEDPFKQGAGGASRSD